MKRILSEALIVSILAAAAALATNGLRTDGLRLLNMGAGTVAQTDAGVGEISIDAAVAAFNQDSALFADARRPADFAAGHIAGAVNLPAGQPDRWLENMFAAAEPDKPVITYCAGSDCTLSKRLAETLSDAGFERVFYLVDGWGQWTARNLPTEKGKKDIGVIVR